MKLAAILDLTFFKLSTKKSPMHAFQLCQWFIFFFNKFPFMWEKAFQIVKNYNKYNSWENKNKLFFFHTISYSCVFIGQINEMHILINEKSNREISGFFKISQNKSGAKFEPTPGMKPYLKHCLFLWSCLFSDTSIMV